jgi:hypothetical protein
MMGEEEEEEDGPSDMELPPVLVTFEGSARGLNFDAVITSSSLAVGRPTSAASYLHLAGRVGRAMPSARDNSEVSGEVEVRPGTIVSFCSKGRARAVGEVAAASSRAHYTTINPNSRRPLHEVLR